MIQYAVSACFDCILCASVFFRDFLKRHTIFNLLPQLVVFFPRPPLTVSYRRGKRHASNAASKLFSISHIVAILSTLNNLTQPSPLT